MNIEERNELICRNLKKTDYAVMTTLRHLSPGAIKDDIIQAGRLGLIEASCRYDETQGATFFHFSRSRIFGSVLDHLRSIDWMKRKLRVWEKKISRAEETFFTIYQRPGSRREIAQLLGISLDHYEKLLVQIVESSPLYLGQTKDLDNEVDELEEEFSSLKPITKDGEVSEEVKMAKKEMLQILTGVFQTLDEREKIVLTMYYYFEVRLGDIGIILNLTEARISQIKNNAENRLRDFIQGKRALYNAPTHIFDLQKRPEYKEALCYQPSSAKPWRIHK